MGGDTTDSHTGQPGQYASDYGGICGGDASGTGAAGGITKEAETMQDTTIYYQKFGAGCFQLARTFHVETEIKTGFPCSLPFLEYDGKGQLVFLPGFAWDGASVPGQITAQTVAEIILSLPHDGKFRLFREGLIDPKVWLETANKEMRTDALKAGMPYALSEVFFVAVDEFGAANAYGGNPILSASMEVRMGKQLS